MRNGAATEDAALEDAALAGRVVVVMIRISLSVGGTY